MPLVHLASRLYGTPLLIARAKLDVILFLLGPRLGLATSRPEPAALLPAPMAPAIAAPEVTAGIAVISIHGTLVRRALGLEAASGLTSYGEIAAQLEAAANDPQVQGILLDIDSPGGEAGGVFELAARIRAVNSRKPVWAHANDAAYSAAYALAAGASRLTLAQTAGVGSIGVIALHVDQSVKDAKDGLSYTAIYAGQHKNDYSPHAPLSPAAVTTLQAEVDRLYDIFVTHVAQMRDVDPEAIRALEAGLVFGEAAVSAGLADAVASLDQVVADFAAAIAAQRELSRSSMRERVPPARASPSTERSLAPMSVSFHPSMEISMHEPDPAALPDPAATPAEPSTVVAAPAPAPLAAGNTRAEAQAIAELCLIAGQPEQTAAFLASGMTEVQVRHALLDARAEQTDITSHLTVDAGTTVRPEAGPVVAAVKKLFTRE